MTPTHRATPALAMLALALCCPGCTTTMWSDAVQARAGPPRAEGLIPAASPGEPDRLFLSYSDHPERSKRYYAVALLDRPADGAETQPDSTGGQFQRLTPEAFQQWRADPRWLDVNAKYAGQSGGGPEGRDPGGVTALQLRPAYRPPHQGKRGPPPPPPPEYRLRLFAALEPWDGRVIWVPGTVARPQSERTADVLAAVALTPTTVVADVVWVPIMMPILLLYSAGGHTC